MTTLLADRISDSLSSHSDTHTSLGALSPSSARIGEYQLLLLIILVAALGWLFFVLAGQQRLCSQNDDSYPVDGHVAVHEMYA